METFASVLGIICIVLMFLDLAAQISKLGRKTGWF